MRSAIDASSKPGPGSMRHQFEAALYAPRVLLAEDDGPLRHLVAGALRRDGCEVFEAADGLELVTLIACLILRPPVGDPGVDLVIADIHMPIATGLDVLGGLRGADWATPFILMTAFADDATHGEATRLGASALFEKPFDLDDLRTAVMYWTRP